MTVINPLPEEDIQQHQRIKDTSITRIPGVALVKKEFMISIGTSFENCKERNDSEQSHDRKRKNTEATQQNGKVKEEEEVNEQLKVEVNSATVKKLKGKNGNGSSKSQNKQRRILASSKEKSDICHEFASKRKCSRGDACKFSHDLTAYMAKKETDIGTANHFI